MIEELKSIVAGIEWSLSTIEGWGLYHQEQEYREDIAKLNDAIEVLERLGL